MGKLLATIDTILLSRRHKRVGYLYVALMLLGVLLTVLNRAASWEGSAAPEAFGYVAGPLAMAMFAAGAIGYAHAIVRRALLQFRLSEASPEPLVRSFTVSVRSRTEAVRLARRAYLIACPFALGALATVFIPLLSLPEMSLGQNMGTLAACMAILAAGGTMILPGLRRLQVARRSFTEESTKALSYHGFFVGVENEALPLLDNRCLMRFIDGGYSFWTVVWQGHDATLTYLGGDDDGDDEEAPESEPGPVKEREREESFR